MSRKFSRVINALILKATIFMFNFGLIGNGRQRYGAGRAIARGFPTGSDFEYELIVVKAEHGKIKG